MNMQDETSKSSLPALAEDRSPVMALDVGVGSIAPLHEVRFSPWIRRIAVVLLVLFLVGPLIAAFSPWQQYVLGSGRVIAFDPRERPQLVESPIKGRVVAVHVIENQYVEVGDLLVELVDIDPEKLQRLDGKLDAARDDKKFNEDLIRSYDRQIETLESARDEKIASLDAKMEAARQKLLSKQEKLAGLESLLVFARLEAERLSTLEESGAAAELKVRETKAKLAKAEADYRSAEAAVRSAEAGVREAEANRNNGRDESQAKVIDVVGKRDSARAKVAEVTRKMLDVESERSAQQAQDVRAKRAGRVFRVEVNPDNSVVKQGQRLLQIVPDVTKPAAEVEVLGNDASLVEAGRRVRLQFEGYPAVQFVGWPSVAVGTFGGVIAQVDATDLGNGRFRVLVVPDPEGLAWPKPRWLRQGVRAKGWVLLDQVPLWYEIWRQLNGFPPEVSFEDPRKGKDSPASVKSK